MAVNLAARDLDQIRHHGLDEGEVRRQLSLFAAPPRPAALVRPCTVGDGIVRLEESTHERLQNLYRTEQSKGRFSKLVPASGAASRMFRPLLAVHRGEAAEADREAARRFLDELPHLPFHDSLEQHLADRGHGLESLRRAGEPGEVLSALLGADGLDLASSPKALVPFHSREEAGTGSLTPLEEHLVEAVEHLRDRDGRCRVHFTVPQHQEMAFREHLREIAGRLEPRFRASLEVSLSVQSPETDTVAGAGADAGCGTGEAFRDHDGRLLFRPGGHGALLSNLARLDGDLVFVRNIDNVQPAHRRREVLRWNRLLGGYLVAVEQSVAEILSRLERARAEDPEIDAEIRRIAELFGQPDLLSVLGSPPRAKQAFLAGLLDRPIRVAGVVPNAGEPGGGPFWVMPFAGAETLQQDVPPSEPASQ
ncbi:MAG: DUF4301 family protein, partial [Holophagales bacterium]|nr:DUF4301 family protein [Holophagales bacterium]